MSSDGITSPRGTGAPALDPQLVEDLARETRRLGLRLEHQAAKILVIALAAVVSITLAAALLGARVSGWVLLAEFLYVAWYSVVWGLTGRDRYPRWMRVFSTVAEPTFVSLLIVGDAVSLGSGWALSGAAALGYPLAITLSLLRLDPRLPLLSGAVGAAQYAAVVAFLVSRATPAELAHGAFAPFVTSLRVAVLAAIGTTCYVASVSIQKLLVRQMSAAVERERVRSLFGVYVSQEVVDHILAGGVREGGEKRSVTIVFTDIRGFTTLSEGRSPEEILRLLNLYFTRMCEVVGRHGGVVNKFLGDGMLVVFGAPAELRDDASRALAASREMLDEVRRMRESGEFPGLRIGIGVHRGETVVGNLGGSQRQEYAVIGDTVNAASRVQDLTKGLGRAVLVTDAVKAVVREPTLVDLGDHAAKGREQRLRLYALPTTEDGDR